VSTTPRVVVISLAYKPHPRVRNYVRDLVEVGVHVDLLVAERNSSEEIDLDPRVRVSRVLEAELDLPVRKIERFLVYGSWTKAFGKVRSYTRGRPVLRKIDAALALSRRRQQTVSRVVHMKMFWPVFRFARPFLLARRARRPADALDLANADRVVAADAASMPLAWRLARRYPDVRVTSALDLKPYVDRKRPA
jgi:hypothetical protein